MERIAKLTKNIESTFDINKKKNKINLVNNYFAILDNFSNNIEIKELFKLKELGNKSLATIHIN